MSYKTILVHADLSPQAVSRIQLAAQLAGPMDAHLIGATMTGLSRFAYPGMLDPGRTVIASYAETLHQQARQAQSQFEALAQAAAVRSYEPRLIGDDTEGGLVQFSRFADLLVISRTDPAWAAPDQVRDLAEAVVLNAACPVLLVPLTPASNGLDGTVLVAWSGSRESAHAVSGALPLLRRAARVVVVHFQTDDSPQQEAQAPELLARLARHGIQATLEERQCGRDAGAALLALAAELGAGLIVQGGYGHARFRELVLGGVTRSVLQHSPVPVLMAH